MRPDLINSLRGLSLASATLSTGCRLPIQRSRRLGARPPRGSRLPQIGHRLSLVVVAIMYCRAQAINTLTTAAHYLCTRILVRVFYNASRRVASRRRADAVRHSRNSIMRLRLSHTCALRLRRRRPSDRRARSCSRSLGAPRAHSRSGERRLESGAFSFSSPLLLLLLAVTTVLILKNRDFLYACTTKTFLVGI